MLRIAFHPKAGDARQNITFAPLVLPIALNVDRVHNADSATFPFSLMLDAPMNHTHVIIPSFRSEDEFRAFLDMADDADNLSQSLSEYEKLAHEISSKIKREYPNDEIIIHRDNIVMADMIKWLAGKQMMNIAKNRSEYYTYLARILYC